jgi:hypothetical protein
MALDRTYSQSLMKLGGSLGNAPQKLDKLVIKTLYFSDC